LFNCPRCKAELPGDPRVCPHCGADQGGGVQPSAYQPTSAAYEANWSAAYPCVAIDSAAAFMVARGFVLEPRTESSANFGNREEPNVALGCFLMLFLIIPGVIYLLMGGTASAHDPFARARRGGEPSRNRRRQCGGTTSPTLVGEQHSYL
jgi:hypothetical protein